MQLKIAKLSDQNFEKKNSNTIHNRDSKNSFGSFVLTSVNVISKQSNIAHQTPNSPKGNESFFIKKNMNKFIKRIAGEPHQINDKEND